MSPTKLMAGTAALFTIGVVAACSEAPVTSPADEASAATEFVGGGTVAARASSEAASQLTSIMDAINVGLEANGENYRVAMVEYVTGSGDEAGATLIQKDVGNKQLGFDFVPFDSRRSWSGPTTGATDDITYAIDQTGDAVPPLGGLTGPETDAALVRATTTWSGLSCSNLPQTRNPDFGLDIGVVAFLNGLGGSPLVFADVQHAGWRDINFAGGVLGATFTFGFTSGGSFTDIDNNGKFDTAFREIYYDPSFSWADDGVNNFDVETVALHEIGHGLSQAHFGNIFIKKGTFTASPRAVMNAFIFGVDRELFGTDGGGHCSNWAQWPNN